MFDDDKPQLSAAARIDEEAFLARVASDLSYAAKHGYRLEEMQRSPPALAPMRSGITQRQLDKAIGDLLKRMGEIIGKELRALRQRVAELEAERGLKYVGPWKQGGDYKPGEFVSYAGGVWHCKQHTGTRPNQCYEAWTLAVKSGRAK